uniref:FkbM family methyltransferase n=1 Tax=Agathobacter sp. TaxID=2021311 RepID=UPI004056DF5F
MREVDGFRQKLERLKDADEQMKDGGVVIFGTGNTSLLYQGCLEAEKIVPLYFCDNNKAKWGSIFLGKEVISPETVKDKVEKPVVLVLSAVPEICMAILEQCKRLGLKAYMLDQIVFYRHREEILDNYLNLSDEMSKKVYKELIMARIYGTAVPEVYYSENQYFVFNAFLKRRVNEVFVDCGAYVGDSVEQYIWKKAGTFGKIYCFEPDAMNYKKMEIRLKRLKDEWGIGEDAINPVLAGIGESTHKMFIGDSDKETSSVSAKVNEYGNEEIDIYALDDYFANEKISFLKADIEGYEIKMIEGAERIIREDKPIIAVCIYHNATDMYYIMQKIKEINPTYRFGIRHHSVEYCETVLYAW